MILRIGIIVIVVCVGVAFLITALTGKRPPSYFQGKFKEINLPAKGSQTCSFAIKSAPCLVTGTWKSKCVGEKDTGGDTISFATVSIVGGEGWIWENLSSGSFKILVKHPSEITFKFDNDKIGRSSPRVISIELKEETGTY